MIVADTGAEILGAENVRLYARQEIHAAIDASGDGDTPKKSWQEYTNCQGVDPDSFMPERGADTEAAKAVCRSCVVKEDCLEYALAHNEKWGIWGGLTERERRRIRRQRALARAAAEAGLISNVNDTDPSLNT